jgi:hypothetical protein
MGSTLQFRHCLSELAQAYLHSNTRQPYQHRQKAKDNSLHQRGIISYTYRVLDQEHPNIIAIAYNKTRFKEHYIAIGQINITLDCGEYGIIEITQENIMAIDSEQSEIIVSLDLEKLNAKRSA